VAFLDELGRDYPGFWEMSNVIDIDIEIDLTPVMLCGWRKRE